ncbi:MFS transporter [Brevibacillus humidisoli]|uniref:MFS transporter n=1 Tax=Brevibacillus humidisoli TaxID=2895522 RepID=UPI001E4975CC|nr:MFS transporter [Brevibacillus humidisoli]UFJ39408.1 MFS transporter [Brevibacillus humidisoli]
MREKLHYAWVILAITCLTLLAVQGVRLSFGAFIQPWEEEFSVDRGMISLISMVSFIVYGISQPIMGKLIDRFGVRLILSASTLLIGVSILATYLVTSPWQLLILYGVLASIGVGGASNVAATVAVTNWFHAKRGLAFGIMEAGVGGGQMILVPASLFLIAWFGWKYTVIVLGLMLVVLVLPILLLLRNHPEEKGLQPLGGYSSEETDNNDSKDQQHSLPVGALLWNRNFWFLLLPFFICGVTTTGLMDTHLIPYSHDHGFSTEVTGAAVSTLAAFNIVGILLSGVLADRWSCRKILCFLYAVRALSIVILLYSHDPMWLLGFAILFGLVDFATVAPTQMLATTYFQRYSIGMMMGWLFLSHQLGSALGAYIPGVLYNYTNSYNLSFYASILLLIGASLLNWLLPETNKRKSTADHSAEPHSA